MDELCRDTIKFQSTLPGWGATRADRRRPVAQDPISIHAPRMGSDLFRHPFFPSIYISIHAPRMGSDVRLLDKIGIMPFISIHAPRMGSDTTNRSHAPSATPFQSTLPGWGATSRRDDAEIRQHISIHAPRVGSDHALDRQRQTRPISIHAPRVGSDIIHDYAVHNRTRISIHAPRVGSDDG